MFRKISRRAAVKMLGITAAAATAFSRLSGSQISLAERPVDLSKIFEMPRSHHYGMESEGASRLLGSLYELSSIKPSDLSFDVSNNQIATMFSRDGTIMRTCISAGVVRLPEDEVKGGVYCTKRLLHGHSWGWHLASFGDVLAAKNPSVSFVQNVLPVFTWAFHKLTVDMITCAPILLKDPTRSPRAIIALFQVKSLDSTEQHIIFRVLRKNVAGVKSEGIQGVEKFIYLDRIDDPMDNLTLHVAAGRKNYLPVALVLEENDAAVDETVQTLRSKSVYTWINDTLATRDSAYGNLSISEGGCVSEGMARFAELARQSVIHSSDGRFTGGFLGSDFDGRQANWNKDISYSMLAMCMFDPSLAASSIPYLLKWGHPDRPTGPGVIRFPGASGVTQSLSNSVSGLMVAGAYYRTTGNLEYFRKRPEILSRAKEIFNLILASRRATPLLFPSMYISDGEARGDYHTGSNIAVWFAYSSMASIAKDAYREEALAAEWGRFAEELRDAIEKHCVGQGSHGMRFFEGANADGTFVLGHDGEESDTTLMPFYGFCCSDDSRLQSHAALALSCANPFYAQAVDGIWWYNKGWHSATFPAWTTAMAGIRNEADIANRLSRISELTDYDGSIWWWPYPYNDDAVSKPLRANGAGKCAWASAVYLCRFVNDILGLRVSVPDKTLTFSPFMPWPSFHWDKVRLGEARFDLEFQQGTKSSTAVVRNLNSLPYQISICFIPPAGKVFTSCITNDSSVRTVSSEEFRWGRRSRSISLRLNPSQCIRIRAGIET